MDLVGQYGITPVLLQNDSKNDSSGTKNDSKLVKDESLRGEDKVNLQSPYLEVTFSLQYHSI